MADRKGLGAGVIALIVIDVLLVIVLIALLVTHPRPLSEVPEAESQQTQEDAARDQPPADEQDEQDEPAEDVSPAPADAEERSTFAMPSRNIWCELSDAEVQCSIAEYVFTPPADPDCDTEVGPVVQLSQDGVTLPCIADGVDDQAPEGFGDLEYGESVTNGTFWCESSEDGVTCRSARSGAGFTLARSTCTTF